MSSDLPDWYPCCPHCTHDPSHVTDRPAGHSMPCADCDPQQTRQVVTATMAEAIAQKFPGCPAAGKLPAAAGGEVSPGNQEGGGLSAGCDRRPPDQS